MGEGSGIGSGVGSGVGLGEGSRVGLGEGSGVGLGEGSGVGLGVGLGAGDEILVSTERVSELLESEPSVLVLPEESEKTLDATEITPSAVLLVSGVKVA